MFNFSAIITKLPHFLRVATLWDVFEILLVAFLVYKLMMFIHNTSVERVLKGILILLVAMPISEWLNLNVINFILRNTMQIGLVAILIMFQPELRRMLESVGGTGLQKIFERENVESETREMIREIVDACTSMSWSRTGALIVFERKNSLDNIVTASTAVDARVSSQLVRNIFFKNSPLHDGAMVIKKARVMLAGCVLPLSENEELSKDLGTRHRAGIGISEVSDAVSVMVSEETGAISIATRGVIRRGLSPEALEKALTAELITSDEEREKSAVTQIKRGLAGVNPKKLIRRGKKNASDGKEDDAQ
ncbi:MAG: diadenylate cyclase CdaA [Eubacteriales bacterium]|nr:diadenylate cyclase CdaA [Eubacteriales bacterium]